MAYLVLENLTKRYPSENGLSATVVNGINLEVEKGEFMVLVGPSGCGKSTTLRMIAGLEEVSSGTISIDGRPVNGVSPKDRDIAMVFQNYALYPHMSVFENMAFGLTLRKLPKKEIEDRVREASAMLGLDAYLDRKPKALSGGQRQRVAVGRAIVRHPKVFLFDEPLSNLDAKMRASTRAEITRLHARIGGTMIYVTHDQTEAMTMGDRICVMKDGQIQQLADPLTLYRTPANLFVAGFIGSPQMNLIRGTLSSEGDRLFLDESSAGRTGFRIPLEGELKRKAALASSETLVLGVRPEDVHDARHAPERNSSFVTEQKIELAEPMGAETYLYFRSQGSPLIARVRPLERYSMGMTISLSLDLSTAHLFDGVSELALR